MTEGWVLAQRIVLSVGAAMCLAAILIIGREMVLWWYHSDDNGREG